MRRDVITFLHAVTTFAWLAILGPLCWWLNLPDWLLTVVAVALCFSLLLACVAGLVMHRNATVERELENERLRRAARFPDPT